MLHLLIAKKLLTNRTPRTGFENDMEVKNLLHYHRMNIKLTNDLEYLTEEMFMNSWNILKRSKEDKYKFLFRGGDPVREACWKLCQVIWKTEIYPSMWNLATLIQLDKGKTSSARLDMKRHIHVKDDVCKLFSHIVVTHAKENIFYKIMLGFA